MPVKSRIFYGYWIIAVAFVGFFISSGCRNYSFGLFVRPLQEEFGWTRAGIMTANMISSLVRGIGVILIGRMIDRFGPKQIMVVGSVVVGLGLGLVSTMNNLWQFYIYYGLAGIGFGGMGFIPVTGLLFKWFRKRRGMAIGVSGVGIGVGSFVMAPLLGGFIIPHFGWRAAFLILGLVPIIVFIPLVLLLVKESPEVIGLQPDGIKKTSAEDTSVSNRGYRSGLSLRQALKTSAFWLMAIPGATFSFATMGIIQNQVVHLTDIGFSAVIAASVVGIVGITNSAGRFSFGLACDRIRPKYVRVIVVSLMVVGILMFMNLKSSSPMLMVWLYTVIMGFGLGGWMPTMSLLVSSSFGMVAFGTIFGIVTMFNMLGSSIGPLFAGYIFDVRGSYYVAFVTFLILYILTLAATLLIRQPKFT